MAGRKNARSVRAMATGDREVIDETLFDAEEKMEKAVSVARDDLASSRTGRANPGMFNRVRVEYYGSPTPITQLSSINVPEARLVVIKPYESAQLRSIEDAIRNSDLGVNPSNDGNVIRISIPQLTEERRRDLVKLVHKRVEEAKVAIRNVRRYSNDQLRQMKKDKDISEDEEKRAADQLQKVTDRAIHEADSIGQAKEAEMLEV